MPTSKYPKAVWRVKGGGFIADGEHLFYATAPEPDIFKFSTDGTFARKISPGSAWFRFPSQDLPNDVQEVFRALGTWSRDRTVIGRLFEFTDRALMVHYANSGQGDAYQVFTKDACWLLKSWASSRSSSFMGDTDSCIVWFSQAWIARVISSIHTLRSTNLSRHSTGHTITCKG